jgi:hypothetical protein
MRIPSIIMLYENAEKVNDFQGSSFVSPAHGCGGAKTTIEFNNSPSARKSGEARKRAGKKKKGCGENEFLPACLPAEGGLWWEPRGGVCACQSADCRSKKIRAFSNKGRGA